MNRQNTSRPFTVTTLVIAAGLLIAGCEPSADVRAESGAGRTRGEAITYDGGTGAAARVTRAAIPGGNEILHGETEIALSPGARRCVVEDVTLDPTGRLVRAEIVVGDVCGAARDRVLIDVSRGAVTASGAPEWRAPSDAPWIYAPEVAPGRTVATPVSAWVARRAAAVSPSLMMIELGRGEAWKVPADQVVVPTDQGVTVVMGDSGADVSDRFVDRVHFADTGVTLARGEPNI